MVKRKVKLAQVLCATYSLSNPAGASRSDIIKFCAARFGFNSKPREYEVVLRRAVDSGLLICFRRRYRLARMGCCILWTEDKKGCNRSNHQDRSRRGGTREHNQIRSANKLRHRRKQTSPTKRTNQQMTKHMRFKNKSLKATSTLCKLWCKEKRRREQMTLRKDGKEARRFKKVRRKAKIASRMSSHQPRNHLLTPHSRKHKSLSLKSRRHRTRIHRARSHRPRSHKSSSIRSERSQPSGCKKSFTNTSSSRRALYKRREIKRLTQRQSQNTLSRRHFKGIFKTKQQALNKVPSTRIQEINNNIRPIDLKTKKILKRQEFKNKLWSRQEQPKCPYEHKPMRTSPQDNMSVQTSKSSIGSSQTQKQEEREDESVMTKDEHHRRMLRLTKRAVAHAESWDRLNELRMRRQVENQQLVKCSKLVQKILTREHGKSWDNLNEQLREMKGGSKSQHEVPGPGGESGEVERVVFTKARKTKSYYSNGRQN